MKILSLFDWISCGYEALLRAWIPIEKYYASEIDKNAITVALKNHPDIEEIWDVTKLKWEDYQWVDLIIWGSPCQWFSMAGKMLNFNDPRSKLFFEFVRLVKEAKPKYFLLENVKMKKEFIEVINGQLWWIQPTLIDSALVSAQNRKRLYWFWELQEDGSYKKIDIPQPEDKGITLKDILQEDVDEKYILSQKQVDMIANWWWFEDPIATIKWPDDKMWTLTTHCGKMSNWIKLIRWRPIMPYEPGHRRLQYKTYTEKCPTLTTNCASGDQKNVVLNGDVIRKLTPIECERLQTLREVKKQYNILLNLNDLEWFLEQAKNYVNAEMKSHKLQNAAENVGKEEQKETALYVEKNSNTNYQQTDKLVQKNVHTNWDEQKQARLFLNEMWMYVNFVDKSLNLVNQDEIVGSVLWSADIAMLVEKIVHLGNDESREKDECCIALKNDTMQLRLSEKEIMHRVKDAKLDSTTVKKLFTSITSNHLDLKNQEQTLITLFCYVLTVIVGSTHWKILNENLLTIETSLWYTHWVSDAQRYKQLWNWWTVDVIAHIFKLLKQNG